MQPGNRIAHEVTYSAPNESFMRGEKMQSFDFGTQEMRMLWASTLLGLVQLIVTVLFSVGARGMTWAIGPRDDAGRALSMTGARVERAWRNFLETFPIFAALVLLAQVMGKHTPATAWGSELYFFGRILYVPVYAAGVPIARTAAWGVAIVGILLLLLGIWPGI